MRIDLSAMMREALDPAPAAKPGSPTGAETAGGVLAQTDTAKLSQDQGRVQELAAKVNQLPEIRQEKVAALQRAVQDGSYQVTSSQTAEGLISAMQIHSAA